MKKINKICFPIMTRPANNSCPSGNLSWRFNSFCPTRYYQRQMLKGLTYLIKTTHIFIFINKPFPFMIRVLYIHFSSWMIDCFYFKESCEEPLNLHHSVLSFQWQKFQRSAIFHPLPCFIYNSITFGEVGPMNEFNIHVPF